MMASRDNPGPTHQPRLHPSSIEGVVVASAPQVAYEHGVLSELYRPEWPGVFAGGEPVEHLYTVSIPQAEVRDEWYFHEHTLDRYVLLVGSLKIALCDARDDSPTRWQTMVVHLSRESEQWPNQIRIPPGVWHSLEWHQGGGAFLNAKYPPYRPDVPDKFRLPLDELRAHPLAEFLLNWSSR